MSQRKPEDIERVTRAGIMRNCLDCGWLLREKNFARIVRTHRSSTYTAWGSRCKPCQAIHDSARKAEKYAREHPGMDPHLGRPSLNREHRCQPNETCLLAQCWQPQAKLAATDE